VSERRIRGWVLLALFLPAMVMAAQHERRDPLRPPGEIGAVSEPSFDASAWQLFSTLVADGRRVAIINDRTVRVGDRVEGARVVAIESGRVELDYRGRRFAISRPGAGFSKR